MSKLVVLVALLATVAVAAGAANAAPVQQQRPTAAKALEVSLLDEVSAARRAHGLGPLRLSPQLAVAAAAHSRAMAAQGFFSHTSADGTPFSRRVAQFYGAGGHRYWSVGENLLWASGQLEARRAVQMWMESQGHRRNLLSRRWREVGFAAVHVDAAPGTFGGRSVVIVTANFGVRG